jgi:hypothetical protein
MSLPALQDLGGAGDDSASFLSLSLVPEQCTEAVNLHGPTVLTAALFKGSLHAKMGFHGIAVGSVDVTTTAVRSTVAYGCSPVHCVCICIRCPTNLGTEFTTVTLIVAVATYNAFFHDVFPCPWPCSTVQHERHVFSCGVHGDALSRPDTFHVGVWSTIGKLSARASAC